MSLKATVEKVPKWAWIASAGIIGGVVVMRHRSVKGAQVTTASDSDATAAGDYGLTGTDGGLGVVSAGEGAASSDDGSSSIDISGLITAAISAIPDHTAEFIQAQSDQESAFADLIKSLPGYAGGGGAPASGATAAAPDTSSQSNPGISQDAPAAQPAATATPAAASGKPTVVGKTPQCSGSYPEGTYPNCYHTEVSHGPSASNGNKKAGTWHVYKDHNVYMGK